MAGIRWLGILVWLAAAPVLGSSAPLKMVFFEDYPPFSYLEDGEVKGIYVDVAREIFEKHLKVPLEVIGLPWARAQAMVKEGTADGFITIPTPERRTYVQVTEPAILSTRMTVYTALANPDRALVAAARTLAEVKKFPQASYLGNGWAKQHLDSAAVDWSPFIDNILPLISSKTRYVFIDSDLVVDRELKKMKLEGLVWKGPSVDDTPVHLCLGNRSAFAGLAPRVGQVLADLKASGRIEAIVQSYR